MVGSILYDFTSWSCHACAKQAPSHRWRCYHCGRRAYRAWGAKHQWRMHGDIECSQTPCLVASCGTWFWTEVPSKPGLQLVVSHTSRLALNESLQQQGLGGQRAQVSATYIPVNLLAAWRFALGGTALRMKSSHWMGLQKWQGLVTKCLPCCTICPRAFAPWHLHMVSIRDFIMWDYQQAFKVWLLVRISIRAWTTWHGQQAFKVWLLEQNFNQRPGQRDMASRPSKFDFWSAFSIRAWTTWHGQQAFKVWLLKEISIRAWTTWHGQQAFKVWLLVMVFNQSLDNVTWPAGLQSLTFGQARFQSEPGQCDMASRPSMFDFWRIDFNQNLDNVSWTNQSLDNMTWPAGLQSLTFGDNFNQSLDNVTWPAGLQSLTFGEGGFNQSLDNGASWPFWLFKDQSLGQRDMASRPSKFDFG